MKEWEQKKNDKQRRVLYQAGDETTHHVLANSEHTLDKKEFFAACKRIKKKIK